MSRDHVGAAFMSRASRMPSPIVASAVAAMKTSERTTTVQNELSVNSAV